MLWIKERLRARKSVSEVIHCRCLASPRGAIDLIDQKEDQEVEDGDQDIKWRAGGIRHCSGGIRHCYVYNGLTYSALGAILPQSRERRGSCNI